MTRPKMPKKRAGSKASTDSPSSKRAPNSVSSSDSPAKATRARSSSSLSLSLSSSSDISSGSSLSGALEASLTPTLVEEEAVVALGVVAVSEINRGGLEVESDEEEVVKEGSDVSDVGPTESEAAKERARKEDNVASMQNGVNTNLYAMDRKTGRATKTHCNMAVSLQANVAEMDDPMLRAIWDVFRNMAFEDMYARTYIYTFLFFSRALVCVCV